MGVGNMLLYKSVTKQIMKNRTYVFLVWVLTILTSLSYFFVKFSIDGNMDLLHRKDIVQENEVLWKNALKSNTSLANIFLLATTLLTCFVFAMFFYRFFRANKVSIGCMKALGMKNRELLTCFCSFSLVLSLTGGVTGIVFGFFLSDVLLQAYTQSYCVTEVVKEIHVSSILLGCGLPILAYSGVAALCFLMISGKEPGILLVGIVPYKKLGTAFHMADVVTGLIPVKQKFPFRIAFRKPIAMIIMLAAIMVFQVCVILGQSLNLSSLKIMQSQIQGHNYEYDIRLEHVTNKEVTNTVVPYLYQECEVILADKNISIPHTIIGMYGKNDMYIPENGKEVAISEILTDTVCINKGLADMYGVKIGETVQISVNGTCKSFEVANIIENAKTACVYCGAWDLAQFLGYENGSYNGLWSMEQIDIDGLAESRLQRVERLERDAVSNKISAVINQATGVLIGVILLFLALFINFQDNQRDMDILRLIGYQNKEIRRLFVDVYLPIVVFFFLISAFPSILLAKAIQKGLSLSIQDYLPFGINIKVFVVMFIMMGLLYGCVWGSFVRKLRKYDEGV